MVCRGAPSPNAGVKVDDRNLVGSTFYVLAHIIAINIAIAHQNGGIDIRK
jgi:hypothetical protein